MSVKQLREHLEQLSLASKSPEPVTQVDYNAIELTPQEEEEARLEWKKRKYAAMELAKMRKEYWDKLTSPEPIRLWKAEELRNKLIRTKNASGRYFTIDSDNRAVVNTLCLYFSNDERLEEYGFSHHKGLFLMGPLGVGKTHLMSFFMKNQKASYTISRCSEVQGQWSKSQPDKGDRDVLEYYSKLIPIAVNSDPFGHLEIGVCFDELGGPTEAIPALRFGERKNVMEEIIMARYANKLDYRCTHFTTNLNKEQIEAKYGDRVLDRLNEMCNVIVFPDNSKSRRS